MAVPMRHRPDTCCRRSSDLALNFPCPRDTKKLQNKNHRIVPVKTPATQASLAGFVSSTHSCVLKKALVLNSVADNATHAPSTPRFAATRTKPVANAECGCTFCSMRSSSFPMARSKGDAFDSKLENKNLNPRNKRNTNPISRIIVWAKPWSMNCEMPVNEIEQ